MIPLPADIAAGGGIGDDEQVWMQTSVSVSDGEKMSFYWKVSSESSADYLKFYINDVLQHQISGNVDWQKKSYTFSGAGTKTLKWSYVKNSSESAGQDKGWVDGLVIGSGSLVGQPDAMSEAVDCDLKFTSSGTTEGDLWYAYSGPVVKYYLNGDSARTDETLTHNREACLQTIVESDSAETIKFYWKVSSEQNGDYLQFYIDSTLKDQISGEVGWQQKSYSVSAGTHILKWRYVKNGSTEAGDDCGWVDFVQWTGPSPAQDPADWEDIAYKQDVLGRRVEKKVDGYSTRYLYDGPHVIAEYDGNNNLLRKYIYGPGVDQPVCMIEVADANATYYYHYDALGSVIALSDSSGDTVQTYEYSVFGEVAVEDANHPNPYMFAGVRYDIEIGQYYNRARYYNPYTGRFLQTDPIGYGDGMNWYTYCGNSPVGRTDPSGLSDDYGRDEDWEVYAYFFHAGTGQLWKFTNNEFAPSNNVGGWTFSQMLAYFGAGEDGVVECGSYGEGDQKAAYYYWDGVTMNQTEVPCWWTPYRAQMVVEENGDPAASLQFRNDTIVLDSPIPGGHTVDWAISVLGQFVPFAEGIVQIPLTGPILVENLVAHNAGLREAIEMNPATTDDANVYVAGPYEVQRNRDRAARWQEWAGQWCPYHQTTLAHCFYNYHPGHPSPP